MSAGEFQRAFFRRGVDGHSFARVLSLMIVAAAAGSAAALGTAAPSKAAATVVRFDVCSALRSGSSLAAIELNLERRGLTAINAGVFTGNAIRQRCPDQAAMVKARLRNAGA